MFTKAEPQQMDFGANQEVSRDTGSPLRKKILLSKILYGCLPYFYLMAAFAAIFATLYITEWFWVLPHYVLCSAACLHLVFAIGRKNSKSKISEQI